MQVRFDVVADHLHSIVEIAMPDTPQYDGWQELNCRVQQVEAPVRKGLRHQRMDAPRPA
jgi:hypothetical protein